MDEVIERVTAITHLEFKVDYTFMGVATTPGEWSGTWARINDRIELMTTMIGGEAQATPIKSTATLKAAKGRLSMWVPSSKLEVRKYTK